MKRGIIFTFLILSFFIFITGCLKEEGGIEPTDFEVNIAAPQTIYYQRASKVLLEVYFTSSCSYPLKLRIKSPLKISDDILDSFYLFLDKDYNLQFKYYLDANRITKSASEIYGIFYNGKGIPINYQNKAIYFNYQGAGDYYLKKGEQFTIQESYALDNQHLVFFFNRALNQNLSYNGEEIVFSPEVEISSFSISDKRLDLYLTEPLQESGTYQIKFPGILSSDNFVSQYGEEYYSFTFVPKEEKDWEIDFYLQNLNSTAKYLAKLRVSKDANPDNTIVGELDEEAPPTPPSFGYSEIYFYNATQDVKLSVDTRKSGFTEEIWDLFQEFYQMSGESFVVWWQFQNVPTYYDLYLEDIDGVLGTPGAQYNLRTFSNFQYDIPDSSQIYKEFKIIVKQKE